MLSYKTKRPRTDGLYRTVAPRPVEIHGEETWDSWHYLRFYPNNRVIGVSTTGTPREIATWITEEGAGRVYMSIGDYRAGERTFSFTLQGSMQNIDYDGYEYESRVDYKVTTEDEEANRLHVRWHSHINGNSGVELCRFAGLDEDS